MDTEGLTRLINRLVELLNTHFAVGGETPPVDKTRPRQACEAIGLLLAIEKRLPDATCDPLENLAEIPEGMTVSGGGRVVSVLRGVQEDLLELVLPPKDGSPLKWSEYIEIPAGAVRALKWCLGELETPVPRSGGGEPVPQPTDEKETVQEYINKYVASALRYRHLGKTEDTDGEIVETEPIDREKMVSELSEQLPGRKERTIQTYVTKGFTKLFGSQGDKSGYALYRLYCTPEFNWKLRTWFLGENEDRVYGTMSTEALASEDELQKRVARQSDSC